MGDRGRKSSAEIHVLPTKEIKHPPAPDDLNGKAKAVWRKTVNGLPADWFRPETLEMLKAYCRHVVSENRLSSQIALLEDQEDDWDADKISMVERLLRLRNTETRNITTLATKLRITLQSTYDKKKRKDPKEAPAAPGANPWD